MYNWEINDNITVFLAPWAFVLFPKEDRLHEKTGLVLKTYRLGPIAIQLSFN